jgi:hypothetical protein
MPLRAVSRGQSPGRVEKALSVRHLRRTATLLRSGLPYVVRHGKKPPRRAPARFPAHHHEGESRATRPYGAGRRRSLPLVRRRDRRPACMALPAYCLMPNHYHVVVDTSGVNVSAGMRRLNGLYAQWFNGRRGLSGHLFDDRFYSRRIESTAHLLEVSRYVVLNPKRAGLCDHPAGWRRSSHRATLGIDPAPSFLAVDDLLAHFGPTRASARKTFALRRGCAGCAALARGGGERLRAHRSCRPPGRHGRVMGTVPRSWPRRPR